MTPHQKPEDDKVRSAKWVVPVAAIAAIIMAALITTFVINNSEPEMSANPADQSSSTGFSSGEAGRSTISDDPDAKANPGAAAAPEKAPGTAEQP